MLVNLICIVYRLLSSVSSSYTHCLTAGRIYCSSTFPSTCSTNLLCSHNFSGMWCNNMSFSKSTTIENVMTLFMQECSSPPPSIFQALPDSYYPIWQRQQQSIGQGGCFKFFCLAVDLLVQHPIVCYVTKILLGYHCIRNIHYKGGLGFNKEPFCPFQIWIPFRCHFGSPLPWSVCRQIGKSITKLDVTRLPGWVDSKNICTKPHSTLAHEIIIKIDSLYDTSN